MMLLLLLHNPRENKETDRQEEASRNRDCWACRSHCTRTPGGNQQPLTAGHRVELVSTGPVVTEVPPDTSSPLVILS